MPQANLTAQLLGLGGATADNTNRLSVNTPALLFNNAGTGIEATVNKAAAANDAAFAFKTGFSARALFGLLGSDDFSIKVSPDGSAFFEAIRIDRTNGQVELPQPTILPGLSAAPSAPPSGKATVYARNRAGAPWIDVMRPSGRDFPLQPHFGVNRIANWSPSVTTTITTEGLPITSVGTVSTPTLAATNLAASMRRWRLTSAAVVDSAADQRSAGPQATRQQREHQRSSALRLIHRINRFTLEVRQFFPKGTDLSTNSQTELNDVARLMNQRPRKTLGWKTPGEAMAEELAAFRSNVALET